MKLFNRSWHWVVILVIGAIALNRCGRQRAADPAPLTPRAQLLYEVGRTNVVDSRAILEWSRSDTPTLEVDAPVDAYPNGLAVAMTPLLVDWEKSRLVGAPDDYYIVHNVNVGGVPAAGKARLATVRIPAMGIDSIEWNFVITRMKGHDTHGGHGQLRFLFKPDALPAVLNRDGSVLTELDDLIISWEAWRPPGTRWDAMAGLDPEVYALTVRCYDGGTRFVNDSMFGHAWGCYPLELPAVPNAASTVFRTCLIQGDALARRTAKEMFADAYDMGAEEKEYDEERDHLRAMLSLEVMPSEPLVYLAQHQEMSYHLLLRSCITQALAAIDMAMEEIYREHGLGNRERLRYAPESLPDWMMEIAENGGDLNKSLARIGSTLRWLTHHSTVLPSNAYRILDEGGLLQQENGRPVRFYYRADLMTPYGPIHRNIAY